MTTTIRGFLMYRRQVALVSILMILFGAGIGLIFTYLIKLKALQFLSLFLMLSPVIFRKFLFNYYCREVILNLNNDFLEIEIKKGDSLIMKDKYGLSTLDGFRIQFPNWRFTELMLKLNSGKKFYFSFLKPKNKKEGIDTDSLITSFHDFIKTYNQSTENKIRLLPSFYASGGGMISIIMLVLLFITDIIVHIVIGKMGILPITLFLVLGLITQVILQRRNDLKYFNKMK